MMCAGTFAALSAEAPPTRRLCEDRPVGSMPAASRDCLRNELNSRVESCRPVRSQKTGAVGVGGKRLRARHRNRDSSDRAVTGHTVTSACEAPIVMVCGTSCEHLEVGTVI